MSETRWMITNGKTFYGSINNGCSRPGKVRRPQYNHTFKAERTALRHLKYLQAHYEHKWDDFEVKASTWGKSCRRR